MREIKNLEKIVNILKESLPYGEQGHAQINYDMDDNELIVGFYETENNWGRFRNPSIIFVCNTRRSMSAADLLEKLDHVLYIEEIRY